ncbi:MAG: hypothetical protein K8H86_03150 [Ignavibacteriaceae bacterium]|nr:hypothetical protein [Ignavibacteriaceae bacterium]
MKDVNGGESRQGPNPNLTLLLRSAEYEVSNIMIYTKPDDYKNKVISTLGYYAQEKFLPKDGSVFYIVGTANGYDANFIVQLDHPLKKLTSINENVETIGVGNYIRVFGRVKELKDYIVENGSTKKLPVLEAIAIYGAHDTKFINPYWVNLMYQ